MSKEIKYRPLLAEDSPSRYVEHTAIPSRKRCAIVVLVLIGILLLFLYSLPPSTRSFGGGTGSWQEPVNRVLDDDDEQHFNYNRSSYFVNTVGCKMPSMPIVDKHISHYFGKPKPLNCTPAMLQSDSRAIWFRMGAAEIEKYYGVANTSLIKCCYRAFARKANSAVRNVGREVCFRYGEWIEIRDEFIAVTCSQEMHKKRSTFYKDYFAFVPLKKAVEERCMKIESEVKVKSGGEDEKLSVMILGIDSVSRLNFHRQMPLTTQMVLNRLEGVELLGYNKVGDNTYPNLVPVLTGLNIDELNVACHPYRNGTFDLCPFIWRRFVQAGYRTFYTEDATNMDTFNYCRKGFKNQPTDYYLRNFFRQAESHIGYNKRDFTKLCLGGRSPAQILAEYARKIIASMKNRLSFSLLWSCAVTHDGLNNPSLIDETNRDLLEHMEHEGFLNNTAVVLLSDHGMRHGSFRNSYQGMMEERQPFIFLLLPKWFQQKYPSAYRNLRQNRRQLTSPFDFHETLNDLIDLSSVSSPAVKQRSLDLLETNPIPRGISLFLPIPPSRNCAGAGITPHWCTCHDHTPLAIDDSRVLIATQYALQSLNDMLAKYPQCSVLYLHAITDANLGMSIERIVSNKTKNQFSDVSVRFVTQPGDGQFEATVRLDSRNRSSLTGSISRTNLYGRQSRCVDDARIKLYCFCAG